MTSSHNDARLSARHKIYFAGEPGSGLSVPKYRLTALGDAEFETMIQALLKRVIGPGTITFGAGPDGAREATFVGVAPYPSKVDRWSGNWVFQVKFHDIELVGITRARQNVVSEIRDELLKLTKKYKRKIDNYILITNVPLTGVHEVGTLDRIENQVFKNYRSKIPHLAVWGADDVSRLLDIYPEVRQPYLPLLIAGDVIAELLTQADKSRSDRATTIDMYLRTAISREENAQLDQAGDVSEDPIPLQQVFFDLAAYVPSATDEAVKRHRTHMRSDFKIPFGENSRVDVVQYLLASFAPDRIVIVGGPGEGKSTIGQYLAQLHRAVLLGTIDEIAIAPEYVPVIPRLPFRVVLRDFAQWLADNSADSSEPPSLDVYLCENVTRLSTRHFTEKDLHDVLRTDPALLILDGLDEVTDSVVRRRLLTRLVEFLDRCQNTLHCDLQVVAATRPSNYNDQFDPKTFLHFRLHKLLGTQVKDYVDKWATARALDEFKTIRLTKTINECLDDNQISLLMTTPLQVTILILIINSGGTPPRQREALFDEYLEVIYKREKAKGLDIVKTEKELLIGLHKFVGYLLHEEATKARTSSATLSRSAYDRIVVDYLRNYDPYSPADDIQKEWKSITVDAGERLVLIVESPVDVFGFELRSIQEFFAACYLSDTAGDTRQRYERLAAIARLPHWRNVTLFFAGRVGRSYPGEAANVVEVCKDMDRAGADLFVKRGAEVALELAAERALGPNRVLQRSLLEYGLTVFDFPISIHARASAIDLVRRLPAEDIRDHVLPVLEQRLAILGHVALCNACYLLQAIAPENDLFRASLVRLAAEAGKEYATDVLLNVVNPQVSSELRKKVIRVLLEGEVPVEDIADPLTMAEWPLLYVIGADIKDLTEYPSLLDRFMAIIATQATYMGRGTWESFVPPKDSSLLAMLLRSARAIATLANDRPYSMSDRTQMVVKRLSNEVAENVKLGRIVSPPSIDWLLWVTHFIFGEVTRDSWIRCVDALEGRVLEPEQASAWNYSVQRVSPIGTMLYERIGSSSLKDLTETAQKFGGAEGTKRWAASLNTAAPQFNDLSSRDLSHFLVYGPGFLPDPVRQHVEAILASSWHEYLQPIALEWMSDGRQDTSLSLEEFERLALWFGDLPSDSPWRRQIIAHRVAIQAVILRQIQNEQAEVFLDILSNNSYWLANLAVFAAGNSRISDTGLRSLLSKRQIHAAAQEHARFGLHVDSSERRYVILRLLGIMDDDDESVGASAANLILSICLNLDRSDGSRSAIRSRDLDLIQERLLASQKSLDRRVGIALYSVRPPRSAAEWQKVCAFLRAATEEEDAPYWSQALSYGSEVARNPDRWVQSITSVLQSGVEKNLSVRLIDVLRNMLPRESQSLGPLSVELGLPTRGE